MNAQLCAHCGKHRIHAHTLEQQQACDEARRLARCAQQRAARRRRSTASHTVKVGLDPDIREPIYPTSAPFMRVGEANRRVGWALGGLRAQFGGKVRTRFKRRTGQQAHAKRPVAPSGRVLGQRSTYRPRIDRVALREQYAHTPTMVYVGTSLAHEVWYDPRAGAWRMRHHEWGERRVGEETALMKLGHLPKRYRRSEGIPVTMIPMPRPIPGGKRGKDKQR